MTEGISGRGLIRMWNNSRREEQREQIQQVNTAGRESNL